MLKYYIDFAFFPSFTGLYINPWYKPKQIREIEKQIKN